MKKIIACLLCLCLALSLTACDLGGVVEEVSEEERYTNFMTEWSQYPQVAAVNARVHTEADGRRVLMADVRNLYIGTSVSDVTLSFAVWNAAGEFVIIKSKNTPDNTASEFTVDVPGVTIDAQSTWIADKGLYLDASCEEIAYVKAAVVSYKFEGVLTENEYYEGWKTVYLENPLTAWMRDIDAQFDPQVKRAELNKRLKAQGVYITRAEVWDNADEQELFLTANLKNESGQTVTGFTLAFMTWDADGELLSLSTVTDDEDVLPDYDSVKQGSLRDVTVADGEEWIGCEDENGEVTGLSIDYAHKGIVHVEAIVSSYTTEDGQTHENACFEDWKAFHIENPLGDWLTDAA